VALVNSTTDTLRKTRL